MQTPYLAGTLMLAAALGCSSNPAVPADCGPFPDWSGSSYVLPYPAGAAWEVNQANCSGKGHSGFWEYGYDFSMPIGTVVTAARDGVVGWSVGSCADGDGGCTNLVTLIHADGDVTVYSHLTQGGALAPPGALVAAGDTIALSGNSGYTDGFPHLHFSRHPCNALPGLPGAGNCPTLPMTFSNTAANPEGLLARRRYVAQ